MELKKVFLIITLTLLLVGIVNATEISNNTNTDEKIQTTTPQEIEKTNINTPTSNKQINKKNLTKNNPKTAPKTYDVKNYKELHSALINKDYNSVTLNIKSDIILAGNTNLNKAIKTLEINGNNKTINGYNKYKFLTIGQSNVIINKLNIKNCESMEDGGAIYSNSKLTINLCTFINNHAEGDGGAIEADKVILNNSLFTKNTAYNVTDEYTSSRGGAVYAYNINATNCVFIDNHSNYMGAITSCDNIDRCIFVNNTAKYFAGAVCSNDKGNIINSNFSNNYAEQGGALVLDDNNNVSGCVFNSNSAKDNGAAILCIMPLYNSNININDNVFIHNYIINKNTINVITNNTLLNFYDAVYLDTHGKSDVNNNVFKNNLPKTRLSLTVTKPYEGFLKANGKLTTDDGKALADKTLFLNVEGKIVKVKTNSEGNYNYLRRITDLSSVSWNNKHNLIVLYDGDGNYNPSATSQSFNVTKITKIKTNLSIIKITQKSSYGNMTVTGRFTSAQGRFLINTQLKLNVNGKSVTVKTDKNGLFKYTFKPSTTSYNKISVSYVANSKYAYSKTKITKTFNQTTRLTLKKVVNKNKATYTGTFYSVTGKKLINSKLNIVINGSVKTVKTDNKGVYKYTINNTGKTLKVRVYYDANSKYAYAPTSVTKTL